MIDFTHLLRGATLGLAWFLLINVAASGAVATLARRTRTMSAWRAPAVWFALRMCPAAIAAVFVTAIFAPSYIKYEPREYGEGFDVSLAILALASVAVIGAGAWRGTLAWLRAARRVDAWMRSAERLPAGNAAGLPAYAIDVDSPLMALTGILTPRVVVSRQLIEALSPDELAASIAHEVGHRRAWDNLKRLLMRAAPDLLCATTAARGLERRWASASEHSADRQVGREGTDTRCALASALVKVARLTPPASMPGEPISTFVGGGEIAMRVQRLLDDDAQPGPTWSSPRLWIVSAGAVMAISAVIAGYAPLLRVVHDATEVLVHTLP